MNKIKWRVDPPPTGPYRSFQKRSWPMGFADVKRDVIVAHIVCADDYVSGKYAGNHAPLRVRVAIKRDATFDWRTLKGEFATLAEAKAVAQKFYDLNPGMFRKPE